MDPRKALVNKILNSHPNTKGVGVRKKTPCTVCGRAFQYYVESGEVYGTCETDGCIELHAETEK